MDRPRNTRPIIQKKHLLQFHQIGAVHGHSVFRNYSKLSQLKAVFTKRNYTRFNDIMIVHFDFLIELPPLGHISVFLEGWDNAAKTNHPSKFLKKN